VHEAQRWLTSQVANEHLSVLREHKLAHLSLQTGDLAEYLAAYWWEIQRTLISPPVGERDIFGIYDYVAILHQRGILDAELDAAPLEVRRAAARVVEQLDASLKDATEPDPTSRMRRLPGADAGDGWWWGRIPRSGLPRLELDEWVPAT
jgi:hypothetical protein